MASIILPHEWRSQPQIIGQLLKQFNFAVLPTTGLFDPISKNTLTLGGSATLGVGIAGKVVKFDGTSNNRIILPSSAWAITGTWVIEVVVKGYGTAGGVLYNSNWGDAAQTAGLQLRVGTNGELQIICQNQAVVVSSANGLIPLNKIVRIAFSLNANGTGKYFAAIDGKEAINGSYTSNYTGSGTATIGDQGTAGGAVPLNGDLSLYLYTAKVLPDLDLINLSKNPWQIFAPIQRKIWIPSTGGGAQTGTGALTTSEATLSGSGALGHTGTGSLTTSEATLSGTGSVTHTGTGSLTTSEATLSGTGALTHTGTADLTTTETTSSGSGVVGHTGTGALTITAVQASGSGTVGTGGFTGTGLLTTTDVTVSGSGTVGHTGTGSPTVDPTEVSGTGNVTHTGTGDLTINVVTVSGYDQLVTPSVTGGGIGHGGKRKKRTRTIVVEVNGQEYRVAEENLESFLEINRVKQPEAPVKVEKSKTSKKVKLAPIEKAEPKIEGEFADEQASRTNEFLAQMVEQAFVEYMRRQEDVAFARYLQQMDDEDDELLMMMLT